MTFKYITIIVVLKKYTAPILLSLILLGTSWSLLHPQLFKVHDFVHAARVAEMARGIADGQIPVRWSANFGYGYGMPLFEFYAPSPYFFGAVLWLAKVPIDIVVKLLFFVPSLITVVAAYRLGKIWFPTLGAVLVSAAITLAPYRAVNLFVRGAVAEAWGMAFFVVALLAVSLVVRREKRASLLLITGLVGMVLSHNLTTLIAVLPLIIWTLTMIAAESAGPHFKSNQFWNSVWLVSKRSLPILIASALLAVGLTAFYWLPALAEKQFTQMETTILTGYFDYNLHFLYIRQFFQPFWGYGGSSWGPDDGISFFLGYAVLLGFFLTCISMVRHFWLKLGSTTASANYKLLILFSSCILLLLYSTFLSIQRSQNVWEFLPFLHILQFPWRFLSVVSTVAGIFSVIWVVMLPQNRLLRSVLSAAFLAILLLNVGYFQPEEYLKQTTDLYYTDPTLIQSSMSETLPDFIPLAMTVTTPPTQLISCELPLDCTISQVLRNNSHEKEIVVTVARGSSATFSTAAFPGWVMMINGQPQPITVSDTGLISTHLTEGNHLIRWYFGSTPIRLVADVTSLASILIMSLVVIKKVILKTAKSRSVEDRAVQPYLSAV